MSDSTEQQRTSLEREVAEAVTGWDVQRRAGRWVVEHGDIAHHGGFDTVSEAIDHMRTARARAAISVIVRRCAEVADHFDDKWLTEWRAGGKCDSHLEGMSDGATDIATQLRALAGES